MKLILPEMRFWLKNKEKMYDGFFSENQISQEYLFFSSTEKWEYVIEETDVTAQDCLVLPEKRKVIFSSEDAVPMRSTECFDKNMKKIVYEGDIVKNGEQESFVVEFDGISFNLGNIEIRKNQDTGLDQFTNLEILGNIFENSNLAPTIM
jgi:hypothetical protein